MIINENCESCKNLAKKLKEYDEVFEGHATEVTDLEIKLCDKAKECKELKVKNQALETKIIALKSNRLNIFEHLDIVQENKNLKQALQEIKELADYEFNERMDADDYHNMTEVLQQILQKCEDVL